MKKEINLYKASSILNATEKDSLYCIKSPQGTDFRIFVTDIYGNAIPLRDIQGGGGVDNTDGTITITGTNPQNIRISDAMYSLIQGALQPGANISVLTNDANYTTAQGLDSVLGVNNNTTNEANFNNEIGQYGDYTTTNSVYSLGSFITLNSTDSSAEQYEAAFAGFGMSLSTQNSNIYRTVFIAESAVATTYNDSINNTSASINAEINGGEVNLANTQATVKIGSTNITENIVLEAPNKTTGTYTIATLEDIVSSGVQSVTGDIVNNTDPSNPIINTPSLQEVRDVNNVITSVIGQTLLNANEIINQSTDGNQSSQLDAYALQIGDNTTQKSSSLSTTFLAFSKFVSSISKTIYIKATNVLNNVTFELPNKTDGTYTLATEETTVPYTGATTDVDLGANSLITGKLYLYDAVSGLTEKASLEYTDEAVVIKNSDEEVLLHIEPGFVQLHKDGTIQSNLFTSYLTATRDHYLPDASGTLALTSDLGAYTPSSITLSINGTSYDLTANRSWTVGDILSSGSYNDPTWITHLAYSKLTGAPTNVSFFSNDAGYLTSSALTSYLTISTAASTYFPIPTGTTAQYIRGNGTLATFPTNISTFTNDSAYITSSALTSYLTISAAASTYEPIIAAGTTAQYWRGDKTWQNFPTIPTVTPSALTKTDDTNVTLSLGGTPNTALLQGVSLTLGWTGTLADSRIASASTWNSKIGGSGLANQIAYFTATGTIGSLDTATYPSLTEISYLKGVTSAVQTQINSKEPTVTKGNLTEATSSVLTITGGTSSVIGSGTSIQVKKASSTQAGYLSSADWSTFNNKQDSIGYTPANKAGDTFTGLITMSAGLDVTPPTGSSSTAAGIIVSGSNTNGGTNYNDFLKVTNTASGATNINKWFRINSTGSLEIVNSAYNSTIFSLTDAGAISTPNLSGTNTGDQDLSSYEKFFIFDNTQGSVVTGTLSQTILNSFLIPANTFTIGSYFVIEEIVKRSGATLNGNLQVYKNTTNNLSGSPVLLGTYTIGTTLGYTKFKRTFYINSSGNVFIVNPNNSYLNDDQTNTTPLTISWNYAADMYIIFTITALSIADSYNKEFVTLKGKK